MTGQPSQALRVHDGYYHTSSLIQAIRHVPAAATHIQINFDTRCTTIHASHRGQHVQILTTPAHATGRLLVRLKPADLDWLYVYLVRPSTSAVLLHVRPQQITVSSLDLPSTARRRPAGLTHNINAESYTDLDTITRRTRWLRQSR